MAKFDGEKLRKQFINMTSNTGDRYDFNNASKIHKLKSKSETSKIEKEKKLKKKKKNITIFDIIDMDD